MRTPDHRCCQVRLLSCGPHSGGTLPPPLIPRSRGAAAAFWEVVWAPARGLGADWQRLIIGSCFLSRKDLCLGAAGDQGWGSGGGCFGGSRAVYISHGGIYWVRLGARHRVSAYVHKLEGCLPPTPRQGLPVGPGVCPCTGDPRQAHGLLPLRGQRQLGPRGRGLPGTAVPRMWASCHLPASSCLLSWFA